jgi:hypothetical protein
LTRPTFVDSRRDLLGGLIDYAGLFPPASLDLDAAVAEYREARRGPHRWILGTFVITASRLEALAAELVRTMATGDEPWDISVILDGDPASSAATAAAFDAEMGAAATVAGAEARLPDEVADGRPPEAAADAGLRAVRAATSISTTVVPFLEVPVAGAPAAGPTNAVAAIDLLRSATGRALGAKIRCGGLTPDLFPAPETVAAFVVACRDHELPFKATAGLHHPLRHYDPDLDVHRHGFLNLLAATAFAEDGADAETLSAVVAETDGASIKVGSAGVSWRDQHSGAATIRSIRPSRFASYGSCSFSEPVDDLQDLGIIEP